MLNNACQTILPMGPGFPRCSQQLDNGRRLLSVSGGHSVVLSAYPVLIV